MASQMDLRQLEREAYRATYSDGVIDLFVGLSLLWMGVTWIWLPAVAPFSGLLAAILVTPMLALRRRFVEARLGYVRWSVPRRRRERRDLWIVLAVGVGLLLLVMALMTLWTPGEGDSAVPDLSAGILAWLLAILAMGLAVLMDASRMAVYAAVLAVSGLLTALAEAMPGWPMLLAGIVATAVGLVMVSRFARRYPSIEQR